MTADEVLIEQQRALEAAGVGLWTWTVATDVVKWSPVCYALLGLAPSQGELTLSSFFERVHVDDRAALRDAIAASLEKGGDFEHSFRIVRPDGALRWFINRGRAECSADGRPVKMLGTVQDITRQKELELRHAESHHRLAHAVESSGLGVWTWDIARDHVSWSEQGARIVGLTEGQFDGTRQAFAAVLHPEDRDRVLRTLDAAVEGRTPYVCEFRIVKPNGALAWVSSRGSATYASDGRPLSVMGTIGDISELKRSAMALHAALSASRTGTFHWNMLTNELTWDDELHRLFGLGPAHPVRSLEQFFALVHPDDRAEVARRCERCRVEGADFDLEYRVVHPDGTLHWLYDRGLAFRDAAGRPVSMTGACVDITARVASERALALSRARLDYATRLSGVGFWYCDLPFDVLEWDERVKDHFFFPQTARITINDFYARIHEDDRAPTRQAIDESIRDKSRYDIVYRTVHPDTGEVKWIRALGGTSYAADGTPEHFDGVTVDVTAQRRDQERLSNLNDQLRRQDRLKDEFIATLSHELRNPLAPIRSAARVLSSPSLGPEQLQRAQTIIQRQVSNMALLLDDLLDIARITQGKLKIRRQSVSLEEVVEVAVEAVRPMLSANGHRLVLDLPSERLSLDGDPLRLSQILSNLLANAAKYSPAASTVQVGARREGNLLCLSVRDEGVGIAPESLHSIFDMFAQVEGNTGTGDGLGIGLALVKGLTALHGGTVEARSAGLQRGSEFLVRLPLALEAASQPAASELAPGAPRLKVMVVDDNQDAAETIGMVLELAGHEVRVAHSGQAALTLAQQFRPDTALLDIGMPDLDGCEVAVRLRREAWGKQIKLIAITGWGQDRDRQRAIESGFDLHLTKPVDPEVLEPLLGRAGAER